jgi:hypothetical protein
MKKLSAILFFLLLTALSLDTLAQGRRGLCSRRSDADPSQGKLVCVGRRAEGMGKMLKPKEFLVGKWVRVRFFSEPVQKPAIRFTGEVLYREFKENQLTEIRENRAQAVEIEYEDNYWCYFDSMRGKRRCFAITQQGSGRIYNLEKKPGVNLCELFANGVLEVIPAEAVPVKHQNRDPQTLSGDVGKSEPTEASEKINIRQRSLKFAEKPESSMSGAVGVIFPGIPSIGPSLGTTLKGHMMAATANFGILTLSIGERTRYIRELSDRLVNLRELYWAQYPNDAELKTIEQEYAQALFDKDMAFLAGSMLPSQRNRGGANLKFVIDTMMKSSSHLDLDGGIFSFAVPQFDEWVSAFVCAVKRTNDRATALVETLPLFLEYKDRRDLAEFILVNPKSPLLKPNADPAGYARYWLVATGGSSSLEEAAAWVSNLIKDVGADKLARAVRVARSHTSLGREIKGPWGSESKDFLEHLTGRKDHWQTYFSGSDGMTAEESVKAAQSFIQNSQETIFLARSLVAPFKEEPAVDRIRALVTQYVMNGDPSAAREAVAISNALSERIRSRIESDRTMRYDQYSSGILRALDSLNGVVYVYLTQTERLAAWSGVAKGESRPSANAPQFKRDSVVTPAPTSYIGPRSGQLNGSLRSRLQRGKVIFDGLPEGSLNLRYDTNSLMVETVPGPSGYQRLIFRSTRSQPVFCVRASWSID